MDHVDTMHGSEVLFCTTVIHLGDIEVKVMDRNFMLKFLVKAFRILYLLNILMDQVDTMHDVRYFILFCRDLGCL